MLVTLFKKDACMVRITPPLRKVILIYHMFYTVKVTG